MGVVVPFLVCRVRTEVRETTTPRTPRCYGGRRGHSARISPAVPSHPPASVPAALQGVRKHTQTVMEGAEGAVAAKGGVLGRLQGPLCHS